MTTNTLTLEWTKCTGDPAQWCKLLSVNLNHPHFEGLFGVYVIWHGGANPKWVRVGQGEIANRVAEHRNDPKILAYKELTLYVTWAKVAREDASGVEAFLADRLSPLVGERFPNASQIQVNIPGTS